MPPSDEDAMKPARPTTPARSAAVPDSVQRDIQSGVDRAVQDIGPQPRWLPRADANGRCFDPFVSLALHRAAAGLAEIASGYDVRRDGLEVLDHLADLCSALDSVAVDIWRGALCAGPTVARSGDDPLEGIREQVCALLNAYARALAGEPTLRHAGPAPTQT